MPEPRPRFWELPLEALNREEWEALCDGCGKCCLNKLEDEDTGEVALTRVACRLLDCATCRCTSYADRHAYVPECVTMTPETVRTNLYWLPRTCAYRLRHLGQPLPAWHPLLTGDPESPHRAGASARGLAVSEAEVPVDEWEEHIIEEPDA